MASPTIRPASEADLAAIKRIADGCKREIGFISRGMLRSAMERGELLVAACSDEGGWEKGEPRFAPTDNKTDLPLPPEIVGFVDFHRRRDGQITIYGIVVAVEQRGHGIGRALVAALVAPPLPARLALKCPTDNAANGFYHNIGFQCVGVEQPTRRRPLNLWALEGAQLATLGISYEGVTG